MKIQTTDPTTGDPNGHVILCWNALEQPTERPDQVYVTVILPGCHKGPHLHKVRCGRFVCIKGNVRILTRAAINGTPGHLYAEGLSGEANGHPLIKVPPGTVACIYNDGPEEALVINMPTPAWSREEPDEWPVEDWID